MSLMQVPVLVMQGIAIAKGEKILIIWSADCPIGWFHYSCLKLTEEDVATQGQVYCPECHKKKLIRLRRQRNKSKLLEN